MKILHTSDWHLGKMLYNQKRYAEFEAFLLWLNQFIIDQKIEILLVAGDIFDTTTPSNKSQELYYQFLSRTLHSTCRHIVIVGGNHDSPTLLNAPKDLLKVLNVNVVGEVSEQLENEVITLCNENGIPEVIVCAVPFLRDKDVRSVAIDESLQDKLQNLTHGIGLHYQQIGEIAMKKQLETGKIPIIGMGHLFTTGGTTTEGDGTRDLYVGTAVKVEKSIFPACFDYLALGHLHKAQTVGNDNTKRYSGSPIPMGFNEAHQQKMVVVVEFAGNEPIVTNHIIPTFQQLVRIEGTIEDIITQISALKAQNSAAWLEIECTQMSAESDLNAMVADEVAHSGMKILRLKNKQMETLVLSRSNQTEKLEDLDPKDVFERRLRANKTPIENAEELRLCYYEILDELQTKDVNAN